jgi:hypothetical protein
VTGAALPDVNVHDGRVETALLATRYGDVLVRADGGVDASGDATPAWHAGLPYWMPERPGPCLRPARPPPARWIRGAHQLTVDEVLRDGTLFGDAVARTAWPIELYDRPEDYVWEMFPADYVHYVPLRSMMPPGTDNLVAAERCVDGDAAALSSVRVTGPCSTMGVGAAHALDLVARASGRSADGTGSVHDIDPARLRARLAANLGGRLPARPQSRRWRPAEPPQTDLPSSSLYARLSFFTSSNRLQATILCTKLP